MLKSLLNTNIYFLKRASFHSLFHQKKITDNTLKEYFIISPGFCFGSNTVNLKNKISKYSWKNSQYTSVYIYLK